MKATQDVTCPKCSELNRVRTILTKKSVISFPRKEQRISCSKCGKAIVRAAGSTDWK